MNPIEQTKIVGVTPPAAIVDDSAYTTAEVDTFGFRRATFFVYLGATDIAMAALKVTESDTSGSGHAEIDATDFSDSSQTDIDGSALALPSATDDNKFFIIDIDLRNRKRYLDLNATAGDGTTGTFMCAWCILSDPEETPSTSAERGAASVVQV